MKMLTENTQIESNTSYALRDGHVTKRSPKFGKSASHNLRKMRAWLLECATFEARKRNDDFNLLWLERENPKKISDGVAADVLAYLTMEHL